MNFYEIPGDGYVPTYTRTDFTDALHESFGSTTKETTEEIKSVVEQIVAFMKKTPRLQPNR